MSYLVRDVSFIVSLFPKYIMIGFFFLDFSKFVYYLKILFSLDPLKFFYLTRCVNGDCRWPLPFFHFQIQQLQFWNSLALILLLLQYICLLTNFRLVHCLEMINSPLLFSFSFCFPPTFSIDKEYEWITKCNNCCYLMGHLAS